MEYVEYVEVADCTVMHVTRRAVLLRCGGFKEKSEWVPTDCIEDNGEKLEIGNHFDRLYIEEKMANKKGLA